MTRADLFKNVRSGVREYRRSRPDGHKKSVSEWLLALMQTNAASIIQGNWGWQEREHYFYKLLSIAILCLDDNGVIRAGLGPPLERFVPAEDTAIDVVLESIARGCEKYPGRSDTDLIVMINSHMSDALDSHTARANTVFTLEEIRDIASLATLGLETKFNGDHDAQAN